MFCSQVRNFSEKKLSLCRSMWYDVRNQTIRTLYENKDEVMKIVSFERKSKAASSAIGAVGGSMLAAGLFFAPSTGGVSLALSITGSALSGVSAIAGVRAHIVSNVMSNNHLKKVQEQIQMDRQLSISLDKLAGEYQEAVDTHKAQFFIGSVHAAASGFGMVTKFGFATAAKRAASIAAKAAGHAVGSALVVVMIPIDIGLIIHNLSLSPEDHQIVQLFAKQIEDSLKGNYISCITIYQYICNKDYVFKRCQFMYIVNITILL